MENTVLLSPTDVGVIRRYVHTKYAPLPDSKRAEIVADAIRKTIQRRLPDWSPEIKAQIGDQLIQRCIVTEQRDVMPEDVLAACASMADDAELNMGSLQQWLHARTSVTWTVEALSQRMGAGNAATSVERHRTLTDGPEAAPPSSVWRQLLGSASSGLPMRRYLERSLWTGLAMLLAAGLVLGLHQSGAQPKDIPQAVPVPPVRAVPAAQEEKGMPATLRYTDIDLAAVKEYLRGRDSLLADEPYFSAILSGARNHDVHPLLLLAIAGQEQGFVPKSNKQAKQIANNPFNVFHSWEDYNTNILDTSDIAAKLLAKLGKSLPAGQEPFAWFNQTYAEDPAWSDGVRKLFDKLNGLPRTGTIE